ncbi:MAG: hypothetical protein GYB53_15115 [Rhodobacteraceae bacterium]|nr:hypothetical protein [Paracoccaceae bacterium]
MTGAVERYQMTLPSMLQGAYEVFQGWHGQDLLHGSRSFVWRHPLTGAVRMARFAPGESYNASKRGRWRDVSMRALFLAGSPWFSAYVVDGSVVPPVFVTDFAAAVYGADTGRLVRAPIGDLVTLTGSPVVDSSGLTLEEGDGVEIPTSAWARSAGTWILDLQDAVGQIFAGASPEASVEGTGVIVVAYDGSQTLVYAGGVLVETLAGWTLPAAVVPLDGAGVVVRVTVLAEVLPDTLCKAVAVAGAGFSITVGGA